MTGKSRKGGIKSRKKQDKLVREPRRRRRRRGGIIIKEGDQ